LKPKCCAAFESLHPCANDLTFMGHDLRNA
jgi:hypothetical protein